jgi:glycosyltransferase involved in cell wall biosynthesis
MNREGEIRLSVVIACYNAENTLGEQLESLARQEWDQSWEVVVADNRCTDGSRRVVEAYQKWMPNLRVVDAFERQGTAYAMNVGVRAARSAAIAFCDADDVVASGWVAAMGEGLKRYGFVSGPFDIDRLNRSPLAKHRVNPQTTGVQEYTYPPFLPHAGAGNMGVRREVYDAVGGFDETLEALFDTDFCWKVQLSGTPLTPLPDAVLYVRHRDDAKKLMRQAKKYAEYDVVLYKRYRRYGMPALPKKKGVRAWIDLVLYARDVMREETRARYLWDLGWRTGRLVASIRHRVWAL